MSRFGTFLLGSTEFLRRLLRRSRRVACLGDSATHPGTIISTNQDGTLKVNGLEVVVNGALFNCSTHGPNSITSVITRTYHNGKLVVTDGAVCSCGAIIKPPDRKVYFG